MRQRISISVIPGAAGKYLLSRGQQLLAANGVAEHVQALILDGKVSFHTEHLDLWSMGDSFDRFLRPKSKVRILEGAGSTLYVIRIHLLQLRAAPRDDEERLFRALLSTAKLWSRRPAPKEFLFVLRRIFGTSQ